MGVYAEASREVFEVFERYTPLVEGLSIDEAFLDLSGTERLHGRPREAAESIGHWQRYVLGRELDGPNGWELQNMLTVAQVIAGIFSGSIALLSDAAHNFNDANALLIAYVARRISRKRANQRYTFGYRRAEMIGALINLTLQGRFDGYPRRRGLTRIPEFLARGVNVSFGLDCVRDPWYALGNGDPLEAAAMAAHACPMTASADFPELLECVTRRGARTLGLESYGIEPGYPADFVLFEARDVADLLARRPSGRVVVRSGRIVAETPDPRTSFPEGLPATD